MPELSRFNMDKSLLNRGRLVEDSLPDGLARIALGVQYRGTNYYGWQRQLKFLSVQQALEQALSKVADHPVSLVCAGRTDAGVHASGQVVHFDTWAKRQPQNWIKGANTLLPKDIAIRWALNVPASFHARFKALKRSYRYVIDNSPYRPALFNEYTSWEYRPLDTVAMNQAASQLLGTHDFSSFRAHGCQANNPIRTIEQIAVSSYLNYVILTIEANAFLYRMVRNIMGLLIAIGLGYRSCDTMTPVLLARSRQAAKSNTASPSGLCLCHVIYDEEFSIPQVPMIIFPFLSE